MAKRYVVTQQVVDDLLDWMKLNRITQAMLAERLKTTQSAVQRWLSEPGTAIKGDPAELLEELMKKIGSNQNIPIDLRVYKKLKALKAAKSMDWEDLSEFLDMSLVDTVNSVEAERETVDLDSFKKLMNGFVNAVDEIAG